MQMNHSLHKVVQACQAEAVHSLDEKRYLIPHTRPKT